MGKGDLLEYFPEVGSHGDPDILQVGGGPVVDERLRSKAAYLSERTIEGPHDVGNGNLVGRPGQAIAAVVAPMARDDPSPS